MLTVRPHDEAQPTNSLASAVRWWWDVVYNAASSANWDSVRVADWSRDLAVRSPTSLRPMRYWMMTPGADDCDRQDATTAAKYKSNRVGASVHPCRRPLVTWMASVSEPETRTRASIPSCRERIRRSINGGIVTLSKTSHSAALGIESYAFHRSTNSTYSSELCSTAFSASCRATNIISTQPWPFRKPHWESGRMSSVTSCNRSWRMQAKSFPTTSRWLMPRQLSHELRSPFLGIGTISASRHSATTTPSCHTLQIRSWIRLWRAAPPQRIISGTIPDCPPAVPQFRLRTAAINSSMLGASSRPCLGSAAGKSSMTRGLKLLGIFSTLSKWVCQQDFSPLGLVTRSPFASRSADAVAGLRPLCNVRSCPTHFHRTQPSRPAASAFFATFSIQSSFALCTTLVTAHCADRNDFLLSGVPPKSIRWRATCCSARIGPRADCADKNQSGCLYFPWPSTSAETPAMSSLSDDQSSSMLVRPLSAEAATQTSPIRVWHSKRLALSRSRWTAYGLIRVAGRR